MVTDHAGTPQELVREDGDIEWRGEQALWGKFQQQQFNLKIQCGYLEDAANEALTCDLRYQGQIEDRESGLYYNLNRYYDADSGQYLSPDPIGFAGGLRPQGYVDNPMEWVDPLGLTSCQLSKAMEDNGTPRPKDSAAHHIVPETAKGAQPARDVLKKHKIDVNGTDNGVFLPNRNNTSNMSGILHNGKHPNDYITAVNNRISDADKIGGKQGVLDELKNIKNILSNAERDSSWYTIL
ncbi:RHS repeat-associated core domain-containing protein [Vibrio gazogenes]|uniref:RHS repeat-associated core domain-containing protein n=1 Tax=Vibrio gazogenes TaxID=687 RepID=UPI0021C3C295|nr:RHS repeat-associated core domain-containing protein [Vibrio gazogenes]